MSPAADETAFNPERGHVVLLVRGMPGEMLLKGSASTIQILSDAAHTSFLQQP